MRKSLIVGYILLAFLLLQAQCKSPREQAPQGTAVSHDKQYLQEMNRYRSDREQDIMAAYVARQRLDMKQGATGYYHQIVKAGTGTKIANGDAVRLYGNIFLIDGTPCYSYNEQHPLDVAVGSHTGYKFLNTVLVGLRQNDHVRFIIPAYMAFGLPGDGNKIPPSSILVCDFTVAIVSKVSSFLKDE